MGTRGTVRDPGDLPEDWFGNQPKEQPGSGAARRGNWRYGRGGAAGESGRARVTKQRGTSKAGAALLLGRTLTITGRGKK